MSETKEFEDILSDAEKLPTLPGIAMRILETVRRENSNLKELADILSSDPVLCAEVLKIVNSTLYGLPVKVTTFPRAVSMLGTNVIKNLALSFTLIRENGKGDEDLFNYELFWKNSLIGAVTARLLGQRIIPALAEDAFFLGLLSNIGILALVQCMPRQYSLVLKEMERTNCDYHEAEDQILGFNHMEVGEYLVKTWNLPETFSIPIRYHHNPEKLKNQTNEIVVLTRILHLASAFMNLFNLPDKTFLLGLIEFNAKKHGFDGKFRTEDIVSQIQVETAGVFPLFELKLFEEKDYLNIIESARTELINVSADFMNRFLDQERKIDQFRELAAHDGLTGLINYQAFHELLEKELSRAKRYDKPLSLAIGDIDHFKRVNDTYGHLAGDHVLRVVAEHLEKGVRESDIIARYGGEEFAILITESPLEAALAAVERLREALSELQVDYEGQKLSVTMSFGVASLSPGQDITKNNLIKKADTALYKAKRGGRNRCCVSNDAK